MNGTAQTWNGALSYASPDLTGQYVGRISLFFKAVRKLNIPQLHQYLERSAKEDLLQTIVLIFHLRDCRGGKGERYLGREALKWLLLNYPVEFGRILPLIPEYGRWDDLIQFFPRVMKIDLGNERARAIQQDVVKMMADQLVRDVADMRRGRPCSLCAKWAPSENDALDYSARTFTTLCEKMNLTPRQLRKQILTPLRAYLKVVETYMCSGRWSEIDFNRVPSQAMRRLRQAFERNTPKLFQDWRSKLAGGETKVNAGQLHPHELIKQIRLSRYDEVIEQQWKNLVASATALTDVIPVVDVSGSMAEHNSLPLDVSTSLGLLISAAVQGHFHNQVMTFAQQPSFHLLTGETIRDRYNELCAIPWGGNTDLYKTFQLILQRAMAVNLPANEMPKRVIIISDMQFDQACPGLTNFEAIDQLYRDSPYKRPGLIFWNVIGGSNDFPVTIDQRGVAMISGFSPAILSSLITGGDLSSLTVLTATIANHRYDPVRAALGKKNEEKNEEKVEKTEKNKEKNDDHDFELVQL